MISVTETFYLYLDISPCIPKLDQRPCAWSLSPAPIPMCILKQKNFPRDYLLESTSSTSSSSSTLPSSAFQPPPSSSSSRIPKLVRKPMKAIPPNTPNARASPFGLTLVARVNRPPDRKGPTARPAAERVWARPLSIPSTE